MKKLTTIFASFILLLTLAACNFSRADITPQKATDSPTVPDEDENESDGTSSFYFTSDISAEGMTGPMRHWAGLPPARWPSSCPPANPLPVTPPLRTH